MVFFIVLATVYLLFMPIALRLITFAHYKLITVRQIEKNRKNKVNKEPVVLWHKWREPLFFTLKDSRSLQKKVKELDKETGEPVKDRDTGEYSYVYQDLKIQYRHVFFIIWGLGLVLSLLYPVVDNWRILLISYLIFFISVAYAIKSPQKLLAERKRTMEQMLKVARSKLNIPADMPLQEAVKVIEWLDPVTPSKVQFYVPSTFPQSLCGSFLEQFNQVFGGESAWVPWNDPKTNKPGWNFKEEQATFYSVPPLPQMAPWHERYLDPEFFEWSFFPIGLGVENGVEIENEEGEKEFVIGFDFFGEQKKFGEKKGLKVDAKLGTAAPMGLVAGGTGSGKAIDMETPVAVYLEG